jgi:hypothetical protein
MYKVIKGKEGRNVNGIVLHSATQEQLEYLFDLGHPWILKDKPKAKKKKDDKQD